MRNLLIRYRVEILTSLAIAVTLQIVIWAESHEQLYLLAYVVVLGLVLVFLQSLLISKLFSVRLSGKFGDMMHKFRLRSRLGIYYILPMIFYSSVALYIFQIKEPMLREMALFVYTVALIVNTINMRETYSKHFSFAKHTRVIFNMIDILIFYFYAAVLVDMGLTRSVFLLMLTPMILLLLSHQLIVHIYTDWSAIAIMLVTTAIIVMAVDMLAFRYPELIGFNVWKGPLLITNVFFVAVHIWDTRFAGKVGWKPYLGSILNGLLNFVLIAVL